MAERDVILEVKNLKQYFRMNRHFTVKAVDDISFKVYRGETFGIVGESGSGKSTTGRSVIKLYEPTAGHVIFEGKEITGKIAEETRKMLRTRLQMIFQDPMASLNPRKTVMNIIAQGLDIHKLYKTQEERENRVYEMLETVGLSREHAHRYPHEFSGGQRQRIGIARALIMSPSFVIADEAISALDVSIQAQIVNILKKLQKDRDLTYIFIAHDLSMVRYISDRIAVMHQGKIVEMGSSDAIYKSPVHPYTKALLSAVPHPNPGVERYRKRIYYDPATVNYNEGRYHTIKGDHVVLATDGEYENWMK
ncbi:ABC transporter ATP-binding protein [Fusibacter sp. 3D3]|uniref:ABC transporter ATP-binding protein n=1 Tax=Fusibacter sp. 3D3 TaxID=1048380 RepID=UPI000852D89B|nr:ATP-binding cassette domain-containing protein [Fusibacter sp. 3D3]GAU77545.1 oligopeptide transport ATP-binding protein OppF [Fusibacter sp. 3D3]